MKTGNKRCEKVFDQFEFFLGIREGEKTGSWLWKRIFHLLKVKNIPSPKNDVKSFVCCFLGDEWVSWQDIIFHQPRNVLDTNHARSCWNHRCHQGRRIWRRNPLETFVELGDSELRLNRRIGIKKARRWLKVQRVIVQTLGWNRIIDLRREERHSLEFLFLWLEKRISFLWRKEIKVMNIQHKHFEPDKERMKELKVLARRMMNEKSSFKKGVKNVCDGMVFLL